MTAFLRRVLALVLLGASPAFAGTYDLVIDRTAVVIDGGAVDHLSLIHI